MTSAEQRNAVADNLAIICEYGPPAIVCERHVTLAVMALFRADREPTGEVISSREPCPICLYEQDKQVEVNVDNVGLPGMNNQVVKIKRK